MTEPTLYQLACGLLELRDRIAALEAAGSVAGNPGHAPAAPAGVSAEELACVMREMPDTDYRGEAAWLLNHPRIGPLLRGEVERQQQGGQADG